MKFIAYTRENPAPVMVYDAEETRQGYKLIPCIGHHLAVFVEATENSYFVSSEHDNRIFRKVDTIEQMQIAQLAIAESKYNALQKQIQSKTDPFGGVTGALINQEATGGQIEFVTRTMNEIVYHMEQVLNTIEHTKQHQA